MKGINLRRSLPVQPQDDERLRILTVELYDDGVSVRFVLLGQHGLPDTAEEASLRGFGDLSIMLNDDLGTEYRFVSGGAAYGGEDVSRGESLFEPPVPDHATRLTVVSRAGAHDFDL